MIRKLVEEKTLKAIADLQTYGEGWNVHYALFARRVFTAAARAYAEKQQMLLVDLARLGDVL